jgi:hypothetical protein
MDMVQNAKSHIKEARVWFSLRLLLTSFISLIQGIFGRWKVQPDSVSLWQHIGTLHRCAGLLIGRNATGYYPGMVQFLHRDSVIRCKRTEQA